jgi:hypothetical protein
VVNQHGLDDGVKLPLSELPETGPRYGLKVKATDNQGYTFVNNRSIMLTKKGVVNKNLLPTEKNILSHIGS